MANIRGQTYTTFPEDRHLMLSTSKGRHPPQRRSKSSGHKSTIIISVIDWRPTLMHMFMVAVLLGWTGEGQMRRCLIMCS